MNNLIVSAALVLEFPIDRYMKVLLNKREVILNEEQTIIWRQLRKHESVSLEKLYAEIDIDLITKQRFEECVKAFLLNKMAIVVSDNW